MQILKAAFIYFALVFGTGFVLGTIRVLWLVPQYGERMAELWEMPLMLAVMIVSARWIVRTFQTLSSLSNWIGVGGLALGLLLAVEFTMVLWLRGLTFTKYLASRDPVSGAIYYLMLLVFALMPLLAARSRGGRHITHRN